MTVGKRLVFSLRRPSGEQIVVQHSALAHATAVGNMARILDTDARDGCNKSDYLCRISMGFVSVGWSIWAYLGLFGVPWPS